ncbi:DUF4145 domain-containing protein [Streptomyces sp. NPDC047049]|uniref:DUF4145 domain-containing protein n=1 Tax=Streptomyces sp. NPDC047049 TaxID=3156688 RepID=UPI0033CEF0E6
MTPIRSSLHSEESNSSASLVDQGKWHPGGVRGEFHCRLKCRNQSCDLVWVIGEMEQHPDFDDRGDYESYYEHLHPKFFMPALPLVETSSACPKAVQDCIKAASKVLWVDPNSAANRLRTAVEALMDEQGIPRKNLFSLAKRIKVFETAKPSYAEAAGLLLAVKWIGNVGSHESRLQIPDVLDGVEILDFTLELVYDDTRDELKKKAAEITARKGIPKGLGTIVT